MKFYQDNFYLKKESNYFYNRNKEKINNLSKLRYNKKLILDFIKTNITLRNKTVLEIGCFIGDLLYELKKNYKCKVFGIEPSSLACKKALKTYNIKLENKTFYQSKLFQLKQKNHNVFDIIIVDDVLSWIDRNLILQVLSSIDWCLKPNGYIFLRDFSPDFNFAVKNHHWKNEKIYNFKVKDGHKTFFINSGKYRVIKSKSYKSQKFNKKKSTNPQSILWNDAILQKVKNFTFSIKKL